MQADCKVEVKNTLHASIDVHPRADILLEQRVPHPDHGPLRAPLKLGKELVRVI
jgi:hypothetical protein